MMDENEQMQIFDMWITEHRGLFFKVVRSFAFNPHDQDDLFQEISTQVFHSIPKFNGDSKASTWIYRVALYSAMRWSVKERRHKKNQESIEERHYALRQNVENQNTQLDWLYEQIAKLNEVDRSLTLMMIDGHSYREISNALGISESHVGVRLNRIKKRLTEQSRLVKANGI
jgi:RNA polymerase sigma-70 factor (ECF subfamily)